jgi:hypothetical protein
VPLGRTDPASTSGPKRVRQDTRAPPARLGLDGEPYLAKPFDPRTGFTGPVLAGSRQGAISGNSSLDFLEVAKILPLTLTATYSIHIFSKCEPRRWCAHPQEFLWTPPLVPSVTTPAASARSLRVHRSGAIGGRPQLPSFVRSAAELQWTKGMCLLSPAAWRRPRDFPFGASSRADRTRQFCPPLRAFKQRHNCVTQRAQRRSFGALLRPTRHTFVSLHAPLKCEIPCTAPSPRVTHACKTLSKKLTS